VSQSICKFRQFVNVNLQNLVNLQTDWDITLVNLQIDQNFKTIYRLTHDETDILQIAKKIQTIDKLTLACIYIYIFKLYI